MNCSKCRRSMTAPNGNDFIAHEFKLEIATDDAASQFWTVYPELSGIREFVIRICYACYLNQVNGMTAAVGMTI